MASPLSFDEDFAQLERDLAEMSGRSPETIADTATGIEHTTVIAEESASRSQKRKDAPTKAKVSLGTASSCAYKLIRMVEQGEQAAEERSEQRYLRSKLTP
jgi:hypothetical protein